MEIMVNGTSNVQLLSLKDLSRLLSYSQIDSVRRWLNSKQIKIHHIGNRKNVVFKIDYEVALMIEKGIELRNKYPSNWRELLWFYTTDDKIMELVCLYIDEKTLTNRRFKTIKPKTKKEKELIKELMND